MRDESRPPRSSTPVTGLADPIEQNVEAVVALHAASERQASRHQRAVEAFMAWLARPWLLYFTVGLAAVWIGSNLLAPFLGLRAWDPLPFDLFQGFATSFALFVSIMVLIAQNRLAKVDQRRSQLDLQVSLLIDQRCAKIIDLLEEIRRDSPYLRDRLDPEVEVLKNAIDPQEVATTLESRIEEILIEEILTPEPAEEAE